jgi:histidinol phosphatase-like enzyme
MFQVSQPISARTLIHVSQELVFTGSYFDANYTEVTLVVHTFIGGAAGKVTSFYTLYSHNRSKATACA